MSLASLSLSCFFVPDLAEWVYSVQAGGRTLVHPVCTHSIRFVKMVVVFASSEPGLRSLRFESDGAHGGAPAGTGAWKGNRRLRRDGHAGSARHCAGIRVAAAVSAIALRFVCHMHWSKHVSKLCLI